MRKISFEEFCDNHKFKKEGIFDIVNIDALIGEAFDKDGCFVVGDVQSGQMLFALDLGRQSLAKNKSLSKMFTKAMSVKTLQSFERYVVKNIINVVPNTFLCFTTEPCREWLKPGSAIKALLDAYPCYNLLVMTSENVSEKYIAEDNATRVVCYPDDEEFYYDCIGRERVFDKAIAYSVTRYSDLLKVYDDYRNKTICMLLPEGNPLASHPAFAGKGKPVALDGFDAEDNLYFTSALGHTAKAIFYDGVGFDDFYDMELSLNLLNVFEGVRIISVDGESRQALFFYSYATDKDANTYDTTHLRTSGGNELYEDKLVSDIYTTVPIRYEDIDTLRRQRAHDNNFVVNNVLTGLAFQDNYEFGNDSGNIVNNAERVERIDLGSYNISIAEEPHYNYYKRTRTHIIARPFDVRLIVSLDKETHTGVLHILNLGVKTKPTKYLNEVSCNRLCITYDEDDEYCDGLKQNVATDGTRLINLYSYLKEKFGVKRVGVPRHLILSPYLDDYTKVEKNARTISTYRQIKSSLLYAESMFDYGEELGKIVDSSLNSTFKSQYGESVYDYNVMNISKISMLQYSDTYKDYLAERIDFAVVNLFYLELLQFEESAVKIANMGISNFIKNYRLKDKSITSNTHNTSSKLVLNKIEDIQEEYTKTLDFWNSQTNYYSSNEVLSKIRKNFEVQKDVEKLKRNHREIQQIYDNRRQNASGKSTLIISIIGIILTVLNILEIYTGAISDPQESKYLTGFELFIFENLSMINVIRVALVIVLGYYFVSLLLKSSFDRRKRY